MNLKGTTCARTLAGHAIMKTKNSDNYRRTFVKSNIIATQMNPVLPIFLNLYYLEVATFIL